MKKVTNKKIRIKAMIAIFFVIILVFSLWQNNSIVVTKLQYSNKKIPKEFNKFKIVHISDLHNKKFGNNQENLMKKLKDTTPDIIVITGDLIDRRKFNLDVAMKFIEQSVKIAPIYYVSGNHEAWSEKYKEIKARLSTVGVHVLDDKEEKITRGNNYINIMGVQDPDFLTKDYLDGTNVSKVEEQLNKWQDKNEFKVLLSHRPELLYMYKQYKMDLVFSGHAHGGQIRIPGIGGLVAPDQGFLPKYTTGIYEEDGTSMIVSRGLGNSVFPMRIFNRPEIIEVTMNSD